MALTHSIIFFSFSLLCLGLTTMLIRSKKPIPGFWVLFIVYAMSLWDPIDMLFISHITDSFQTVLWYLSLGCVSASSAMLLANWWSRRRYCKTVTFDLKGDVE